jgi:hypothetical protein
MSVIEDHDRLRGHMLLGALVGFAVWQGATIANELLAPTTTPRSMRITLVVISLAGGAYWSFYLFKILRWGRHISTDAAVATALNDERTELNRLKAFRLAFFAVMLTQLIVMIASLFFLTIPAMISAQLTILVGCTAFIGGFLLYERE